MGIYWVLKSIFTSTDKSESSNKTVKKIVMLIAMAILAMVIAFSNG